MGEASRYLIGLGAALGLLSSASASRANDGTPPWIHELLQAGQDVEVTLAIVGGGEPGFDEEYDVVRSGPEGELLVLDAHRFAADEVVDSYERCRGWSDEEYCADNPGDCADCDGDDVLECVIEDGWCETVNFVEVLDLCVPPGETEYSLSAAGWGGPEDTETIAVADSGEECTPPGGGGGESRCAVVSPGAASSSGARTAVLLVLLGVLGLAALRTAGRRG